MKQLTFHDEKTDAVITIQGGNTTQQWDIVAKVLGTDRATVGKNYKGKWIFAEDPNPIVMEDGMTHNNIPYAFNIPKEVKEE